MEIRDYQIEDETSWVRCRVLSFLDTAYYDIVAREKERYQHPSIELVAVENGVVMEGRYTCEYQWGYFSEKDGQIHRFDLCEECYDKITAGFIIPPDIIDNPELI